MEKNYYRNILRTSLADKQASNPKYSLRAFARDLGIAPQILSYVLNNKRKLPERYLETFVSRLNLDLKEELLFRQSLANERGSLKKIQNIVPDQQEILSEELHSKLITEWEYYAILSLLNLKEDFTSPKQIAERLGLNLGKTKKMLTELKGMGLVALKNGKLERIKKELNTSWNITSRTLQVAQINNLELAKNKLGKLSIEKRQYSSATLAIKQDKVEEVKKLIQDFQNKLSTYVRNDETDSVYQLNIQFFALTNEQGISE